MSLINNMLLDLDKSSSEDHSRKIAITNGLHPATNVPRSVSHKKRNSWPAAIGLATLLVVAALWLNQKFHLQIFNVNSGWPAILENITHNNNEPANNKIYNVTTTQTVIRNDAATSLTKTIKAGRIQEKPIKSQTVTVKTLKSQTAKNQKIKTQNSKLTAIKSSATKTSIIKTPAKPDPIQMAAYHYAEATQQLAQQKLPLALASLRSAIQLNPNHVKARSVLAQKLTDLQQHKEAEQLLRTGIALTPLHYHFSQLLAKLMISQGQHEKALTILERRLGDSQNAIKNDAEYLALLAMQYQTLQQHKAAAKTFNAALKIQPRKDTWWLGLAISLEALQQPALAKKAYQHAATGKRLPIRLQKFTVEKIALLDKK